MKAFYGFNATLPPFADQSPAEQAALLKRWGATAIFGGYEDPAFVDAIHAQGMQIYAEFGCFQGQTWWQAFAESRPTLADGSLLEPIEWYHGVNPSVPAVREQQLANLATLLATHELDGVWLDFIRWPCRWESATPRLLQTSFDPPTLARFAADRGLALTEIDHWRAQPAAHPDYTNLWVDWRIDQITTWVAAARTVVDAVRPQATLGLFAIPWRQADFGRAIHTIIGQDFAALAPHIDIFSPMTYHLMCGQPVPWIDAVTQEIVSITHKPVCPVIQAVDHPGSFSNRDYMAALAKTTAAADGVIVFTLQGIIAGDRIAATQSVWRGENGA